jgi:predicted DNA-binding protein (UPF0251 family)
LSPCRTKNAKGCCSCNFNRKLTVAELPVIDLARAGEITVAEAARTLGVHRGTVGRWCKALGFDPRKARADYVRRMIAEVTARIGGR